MSAMDWEGDPELTASMLSAGEEFVTRAREEPGVLAVLFIGGLARGVMDRFSDLDIIVLVDDGASGASGAIARLSEDIARRYGVPVDAEVHAASSFREREWDEVRRWDMSNCRIVHDPQGVARAIVEAGTAMKRSDWEARVVMQHMVLKWYLFTGGEYPSMVEIWAERGDMLSAHRCLDHVIETVMDLLFALNERFVPPAKWKIRYLADLPWRPERLFEVLSQATLKRSMDRDEVMRRARDILSLKESLDGMVSRYMDMPDEGIVRYYVDNLM